MRQGGPCSSNIPMFYYNPQYKMCLQFYYKGCGGNNNRFNSRKECLSQCGEEESEDSNDLEDPEESENSNDLEEPEESENSNDLEEPEESENSNDLEDPEESENSNDLEELEESENSNDLKDSEESEDSNDLEDSEDLRPGPEGIHLMEFSINM
ncbi:hypothetical protein TNCT_30221 [Trichonephila clavata]|uniref:BPTI/Kunitz inhibitor domain-containing protein n=1 Tax=Trichonephila clavata TaxID=2740835 RepID=A0A8X6JJ68_TRICU|nr:hypothetical protein TNCT_30221 [Trichonephila clavata]